jgi:LysM repeat protein
MNIVLPNEVKNSAPAETNNDGYYIVESGDTFSGIAAMYGISI